MKNLADETIDVVLKKKYDYYGAEKKEGESINIRVDMVNSLVRNGFIDPPKGWVAPGSKKVKKQNTTEAK